jgi:hypothetical protein
LRAAGIAIPALLILIVGFRIDCVMVDVLHAVDQGVASRIIGNSLWHVGVVLEKLGKGTIDGKVKLLDEHLGKWYKDNPQCTSRLQGHLTEPRLRSKGWPKLKAKAAATRHLAEYALHLVLTFAPEERQMVGIAQQLVRFYTIIKTESMFLSVEAREAMPKIGMTIAILYSALAVKAASSTIKAWKMTPKLHLFEHLAEEQCLEHGNPRYYWCYPDEDLAGLMAEVAESCHPATMASSALFKWLHVVFAN